MSVIEHMTIEREARRLIRQARRVSRMAASWRGETICLPCRLHIHHRRIPALLIAAGLAAELAVTLFAAYKFGAI
jgi:hypothetical protein